jgi:hypothetical protein
MASEWPVLVPRIRRTLEQTIAWLVLIGAIPAVSAALWLVWSDPHGVELRWTLTILLPVIAISAAVAAHTRLTRPLRLLVNLLSALREGDYSLRGAGARSGDALGEHCISSVSRQSKPLRCCPTSWVKSTLRFLPSTISIVCGW